MTETAAPAITETATPAITETATPATTALTIVTATTTLAPFQPLQTEEIVDRRLRNVRALTDGSMKYKTATWSPGAHWIAAVPQDGPGLDAIDARTGEVRSVVTDTFVLEPVWESASTLVVQRVQPDGDHLVRLRLTETGSTEEALLTNAPPLGAMGAGGNSISFVSGLEQLHVLQHTAAHQHALPFAAIVSAPAPLTEGDPIVAVNPAVANLEAVQTVLLQIGNQRVTATPLSSVGEGLWLPRWSPDGAKLALTSIEGRLVSSTSDGTQRFDLGPGDQPAWSPKSDQIAYAGTSAGLEFISRDIHLVDWQGHGPRIRLTEANDEQFFTSPSWSPDGRRIAFVEIDDGKLYIGDLP